MTVGEQKLQRDGPEESATESGGQAASALADVVAPFREIVTQALDDILVRRPAEPLRELAARLVEHSASHEVERHSCLVGAVGCTLAKASTLKRGAAVHEVPGLPLLQLDAPTSFELDAALRHLDTLTSADAKIIVFVEPPSPPMDLFFLKGVPYFADITEHLLQRRRRGAGDDACLNDEPVGSSKNIASLLQDALQVGVNTLQEEVAAVAIPASRFSVVELPAVQGNVLEMFDIIDNALGMRNNLWNDHTTDKDKDNNSTRVNVPSILLVSFNKRMSNMTFSRLIAAVLPFHEQVQRRRIASTLESNKARIRKLDYSYVTQYWTEVLRRRDERDQRRANLNTSPGRSKTSNASRSPRRAGRSSKSKNSVSVARAQKRENEDAIFLRVSQHLQSQAATRIQALYRGYRYRKWWKVPSHPKGEKKKDVTDNYEKNDNKKACWVEELPPFFPVLLQKAVERLRMKHGELFGNYVASCPPSPRCVNVLKPSRKVIKAREGLDNDVDSEEESWEEETVILPLKRQTKPLPHFNALRRLMECEFLGGCNTFEYASSIQLDCTGLSVLQRHAYDCYKSLVLNLMHIAFLELYHREMLPPTVATFSEYMHRSHRCVFAWLSAPHLFSLTTLQASDENFIKRSILCDKKMLEIERVLLANAYGDGSLYERPSYYRQDVYHQDDPSAEDDMNPLLTTMTPRESNMLWECSGVYAASAFLSEASWERVLREIVLNSEGTKVAWWSLHPNPAAYINGEPVVLIPRHDLQEVEGRPRFDEFVAYIEETKPMPVPTTMMHLSLDSKQAVSASSSEHRRCSCSGVNDGLSSRSLGGRSLGEWGRNYDLSGVNFASPISTFAVSLLGEDLYLAQAIMAGRRKNQNVEGLQMHIALNASDQYGVPFVHPSRKPLVVMQRKEALKTSHRTPRESMNSRISSCSVSRSGRRRSQKRESWAKTVDAVRRSPSISVSSPRSLEISRIGLSRVSSLASTGSCSRQRRDSKEVSLIFNKVETVDMVAQRVANRVLKEGNFVHERPWITPVCGRAWIMVYEQFISKCFSQLREGYSIVLTLSEPCHVMLFNTACLLKHALNAQTRGMKEEVYISTFKVGSQKRNILPSLSLLSKETASCLSFMDTFYEYVNDFLKNSDVTIPEVVYTVQKVMQENSPGGLIFLDELPTLIKSAEQETNPRLLMDTILEIVQRIELYCWLILFQAFLTSPAMTGLFDVDGHGVFPSFSACVDDGPITAWMERIDPWEKKPENSPDPFHLRYSNGLRRWDDRNYIFRGAA